MSERDSVRDERIAPEQQRYARGLEIGMRAGLALLIVTFALYVSGWLSVRVPFENLPRLWSLPVEDYLRESGLEPGWAWLAGLENGDLLALTGVALLAGISLPCLALLLPTYARRGDRAYLLITLSVMAVLALAASGLITTH